MSFPGGQLQAHPGGLLQNQSLAWPRGAQPEMLKALQDEFSLNILVLQRCLDVEKHATLVKSKNVCSV